MPLRSPRRMRWILRAWRRASASCASWATSRGPRRAWRSPPRAAASSSGSGAPPAAAGGARGRLGPPRRERLAELLDGWSPESEADLAALLTRLARDVVVDHPDGAPRAEHAAEPA